MNNKIIFNRSFFIKRCLRTPETSTSALADMALRVDQYFEAHDAHFFKNDRSSSVIRVTVNNRILVIRRDNCARILSTIRRCFKQSRALKISQKAELIKRRGLETLTPLAVIEDCLFFLRFRSYLIAPLMEGVTFKQFLDDPAVSRDRKAQVSSAVIALIRKWHRAGIAHRDPKASNIIIHHNNPSLLDIEDAVSPVTGFARKRAFARDWTIVLHNLRDHEALRKKAHDDISACFDGDWDNFSKRLIQKHLKKKLAAACAAMPGAISETQLHSMVIARQPPPGWNVLEQAKDFIHFYHEPETIHCLVSFKGAAKPPARIRGVLSMALALDICGINHVKIIDGGIQGQAQYLAYSAKGLETVETVLEHNKNDSALQSKILSNLGGQLGRLHLRGFVHGDLSLARIYYQKSADGEPVLFAVSGQTRWYGKRLKQRISTDLSPLNTQLNSRRYGHLSSCFKTAYQKAFDVPESRQIFVSRIPANDGHTGSD